MTDAILQWVEDKSGLTAVWLNQPAAPRPEKPYIGMQVLSVQRVGRAYYGPVDSEGMSTVSFDREAVVSINIYESSDVSVDPRSALERASDLRDTLELRTVRDTLANAGWSLRAVELLTDAPQLIETRWEPRAVFDVRMGTSKQLLDDLGIIETAEVTGDISDYSVTQTLTLEG